MLSETVGLRTRPVWGQKIGLVLYTMVLVLVLHIWCCVVTYLSVFVTAWQDPGLVMQWCSPRDQGLGLEAPRGQKWTFWSWSWSRRKSLAVFQIFIVILDGSDQGTPWHFVRDNKSSLSFWSHCLRESSAYLAHQHQSKGYLAMRTIC